MRKFLVERDLPGAGQLSTEQLEEIATRSCRTIRSMSGDVIWLQSFVTTDRIYCITVASDEQAIRRHAEQAGFPCTRIAEIATGIDPSLAALDAVEAGAN